MRQAYSKAIPVPNPELPPRSHDNTNDDPQTDEMIGPSPTPEAKPGKKKKNITRIVFDRSPTKTPTKTPAKNPSEVWKPWMQGQAPKSIKDRLGIAPKSIKDRLGNRTTFRAWMSPWKEGHEPTDDAQWNREFEQHLRNQLRLITALNATQNAEEEGSSSDSDENGVQ